MKFDILMLKISALYLILNVKKHPCHLSPDLGLWKMLEVPDVGQAS